MDDMASMQLHYLFLTKSIILCVNKTATYVSKVLKTTLRITTKNSMVVPASKKNKAVWCIPMSIKENMENRFQPRLLSVGCAAAS
jgi:hypothetical protein